MVAFIVQRSIDFQRLFCLCDFFSKFCRDEKLSTRKARVWVRGAPSSSPCLASADPLAPNQWPRLEPLFLRSQAHPRLRVLGPPASAPDTGSIRHNVRQHVSTPNPHNTQPAKLFSNYHFDTPLSNDSSNVAITLDKTGQDVDWNSVCYPFKLRCGG